MANRCVKHGIAAGPDGLCAICHRELGVSVAPPDEFATRRIWVPFVLAFAALLAVAVVRKTGVLSAFVPAPKPLIVAVAPNDSTADSVAAVSPEGPGAAPTPSTPSPSFGNAAVAAAPSLGRYANTGSPGRSPAVASSLSVATARPTPAPQVPPPSQADVQRVIASIPISLYEANWCGHCRRAKAWFAVQHLNVTDYDVDHDEQAKRALFQYNPRGSLPTMVIGERVLVGFSEEHIAQTLAAIASQRLGAQVTVRAR